MMSNKIAKKKRPILITILCVIGFIGLPAKILNLFINVESKNGYLKYQNFPLWYMIFAFITTILYLFFLIKIWKMKRIGVIGYGITAIIELIVVAFVLNPPMPNLFTSLIIFIIVMGLFLTQFKKMT